MWHLEVTLCKTRNGPNHFSCRKNFLSVCESGLSSIRMPSDACIPSEYFVYFMLHLEVTLWKTRNGPNHFSCRKNFLSDCKGGLSSTKVPSDAFLYTLCGT